MGFGLGDLWDAVKDVGAVALDPLGFLGGGTTGGVGGLLGGVADAAQGVLGGVTPGASVGGGQEGAAPQCVMNNYCGGVNSGASCGSAAPQGVACKSVPDFVLEGEFLLNTNTGSVWRYDAKANQFKHIPREENELQSTAKQLVLAGLAERLEDHKTTLFPVLPSSVRDTIFGHIDSVKKAALTQAKGKSIVR